MKNENMVSANMTTINNGRTKKSSPRGGLAWKSGLLTASISAVIMGWALLARPEQSAAAVAAQAQPVQPRVIVVQVPISVPASTGGSSQPAMPVSSVAPANSNSSAGAAAPSINLPPMPQKPVFRKPVTRTRRS